MYRAWQENPLLLGSREGYDPRFEHATRDHDRIRKMLESYLTVLLCRLFSISSILKRTASLMNSEREV